MRDLIWLWKISREVCNGQYSHRYWNWMVLGQLRILKNRLKFMVKAIHLLNELQPFLRATEGSLIKRLMEHRPEIVGAIVWPYLCNSWDAKARLQSIEEHYRVIEEFCPTMDFHVDGAMKLVKLGDIYENLHVVIDRPKWFIREGQLVINLFLDNVRIYSLAFSFARKSGKVVAYVGAIQGRDLDGILDTYKKITKALYGMRPQDFLFELFRKFCRTVGVSRIFAVSELYRHHRNSYFSRVENIVKFSINYDQMWIGRGGALVRPDFFALGVDPYQKSMGEIPSNKRSMYRKRYKLLEDIEVRMQDGYLHLGDHRYGLHPFQ